jgi:hypothetical protein
MKLTQIMMKNYSMSFMSLDMRRNIQGGYESRVGNISMMIDHLNSREVYSLTC